MISWSSTSITLIRPSGAIYAPPRPASYGDHACYGRAASRLPRARLEAATHSLGVRSHIPKAVAAVRVVVREARSRSSRYGHVNPVVLEAQQDDDLAGLRVPECVRHGVVSYREEQSPGGRRKLRLPTGLYELRGNRRDRGERGDVRPQDAVEPRRPRIWGRRLWGASAPTWSTSTARAWRTGWRLARHDFSPSRGRFAILDGRLQAQPYQVRGLAPMVSWIVWESLDPAPAEAPVSPFHLPLFS